MRSSFFPLFFLLLLLTALPAAAGPFTETGVDKDDPAIVAWATGYLDYLPGDNVDATWQDPSKALGPATGSSTDIVSLGERLLASTDPPGEITLTFDAAVRNRAGYDLVVFENGFLSNGELFAELAYVEVSSDGETWARIPGVSLTPAAVGAYGLIDPTDVFNLAGKHPNAYDESTGTPFDFDDLLGEQAVVDGKVDLDDIAYVKIVDAPGGGNYYDNAVALGYAENNPIYDAYPTTGSGGFDLEAVGVVDETGADDDTVDDDTTDDDTVDDDDTSPDDDTLDDDDDADDDDDDTPDWHGDDDDDDADSADDDATPADDDDDDDNDSACGS